MYERWGGTVDKTGRIRTGSKWIQSPDMGAQTGGVPIRGVSLQAGICNWIAPYPVYNG